MDSGEIEVIAENDGGMDIEIGMFNIVEARQIYVMANRASPSTLTEVVISKILVNFDDGDTLDINESVYAPHLATNFDISQGKIYSQNSYASVVSNFDRPASRVASISLQNLSSQRATGIAYNQGKLYYREGFSQTSAPTEIGSIELMLILVIILLRLLNIFLT